MKRVLGWVGACVLLAVPARAGEGTGVSIGYSFLKYLEDGGGSVPLGFYLSLAGRGAPTFELDVAYHRDSETGVTLNTFTALLGPRYGPRQGRYGQDGALPYFHVLGGLRRDRLSVVGEDTASNTSWGGMTGLGVDLKVGQSFSLRLGADFQMFWDSVEDNLGKRTESLKTLRFSAGLTF